jgi:rod shape-determining protein MreD
MVRSALGNHPAIGRGPRASAPYVPAVSVVLAALVGLLPIVAQVGWGPSVGFLMLIAWRLLRGDAFPGWWAAPLGLWNDLVTGGPLGLSVFVWPLAMLLLDLADRRTMWRDYWIEWLLAAVLLFISAVVGWEVDAQMGARQEFHMIWTPLLIAILAFPLAAWAASRLDRWRLGR